MEARVVEIMDDLERRGGMVKAVEEGYLQRLISEEAFARPAGARLAASGPSSA